MSTISLVRTPGRCSQVTCECGRVLFDPHHEGPSIDTRFWNGDTGCRQVPQICPTTVTVCPEYVTSLQYWKYLQYNSIKVMLIDDLETWVYSDCEYG